MYKSGRSFHLNVSRSQPQLLLCLAPEQLP